MQWRHSIWSAFGKHPLVNKKGWVLALAGTRFFDRKTAKRYGFNPDHIVGVDMDKDVVSHNTEQGRCVIQRDLAEVMKAWDESRPVSVVMADFCCNGGAKPVQETLWAWAHMEAFKNSWLVLNVSVGRETRAFLEFLQFWEIFGLPNDAELKGVHRGRAAVEFFFSNDLTAGFSSDLMEDAMGATDDAVRAEFRYRAHKMNMDTVICGPAFTGEWNENERLRSKDIADPSLRRHIGAKLAWLTMRKTGKLGGRKAK
ncbi:hypothetical protein [[Eubacterium] cellulosolvens]